MNESTDHKLKVYHLISGDLWAGAETMAFNLLRRLNEYEDLDISVILFNQGRLADELKSVGITVHIIDESLNSFSQVFITTKRIVNNNIPDILHSHRYKENLLALLLTSALRRTQLITTQHGLPEILLNKPTIIQNLKMHANFFLLKQYFTTVAVSKDIRSALINGYKFDIDKVKVIHNGIELPEHVSQNRDNSKFVIGSSGRLFPVKDFPLMVQIASIVIAKSGNDVRFELAGDGPELPAVKEMIERYGIKDNFIIKGHVNDMDSFYSGLDVYLNTSVHEGIPMTIIESLSHRIPVIAPAVGGIVEILENGNEGFLINSRDPQEFADKIILLSENAELRESMARSARKKSETAFRAEMMAERYHQLYKVETQKHFISR